MKTATDTSRFAEPGRDSSRGVAFFLSFRRWFVVYALVALAAISWLPRLVPSVPSASDSYLFGYNNRIGVLLLGAFVTVGVISTRGFDLGKRLTIADRKLRPAFLWGALATVAGGCGLMCLLAARFGGFGESFYLIDRIWLLDHGRMPYRDFEFIYGPAQLYVPLLLHRLFHLGIGSAYYLCWAVSDLAGVYLLFRCVCDVKFPTPAKPEIFALLFGAGLFAIVRMGTNYTFLRYALPIYLVLTLDMRFRDSRVPGTSRDALVAAASCGILTLLSPETAAAYAFASLCVVAFCRPTSIRGRAFALGMLIILYGVIFATLWKLHVLDAMLADGAGAISFPIVPGPPILVYWVAIFVCACHLYQVVWTRSTDDSLVGLIFFSIPMVVAALGRCDPSHVFWNGLSAFLASLLILSHYRRAWRMYAVAFALFVFLAPDLSEFYLFVPQLRSAHFFDKHPEARPNGEQMESFLASWPDSYLAPFGYRPDGLGTYHSSRIEFGRYEDLIGVSTPASVEEKVREMRENPGRALILPYHAEEYCRTNQRTESHYLEALLLFPYIGRFVHDDFARQPICDYMSSHYQMALQPSARTFWYGIWIPADSSAH